MKTLKLLGVCLATLIACAVSRAQADATLTAESPTPLAAGTRFTAKLAVRLDPGWHISSLTTPDGRPVRTEIAVTKGPPFKLAGKIEAPEPMRRHSGAFCVDVETYEGEVVFTLPLEAAAAIKSDTPLAVEITCQACPEENCMLPRTDKVKATIALKAKAP